MEQTTLRSADPLSQSALHAFETFGTLTLDRVAEELAGMRVDRDLGEDVGELIDDAFQVNQLPQEAFVISEHNSLLASSNQLYPTNEASMGLCHGEQEHSLATIFKDLRDSQP